MNNKFAENLKKIRKENNLSQEQLSEILGVSRQAISKWESKIAYPEMEKIVLLCDKFNLNIDDLLNKDIKELKGEEESKKKIGEYINDVLCFLTDTINLFSNMNFKSKIKCIIEQGIILFLLFITISIIGYFGNSFLYIVFSFLPYTIFRILRTIISSIYEIISLFMVLFIMIHIFKVRYLDYYQNIKKDSISSNNDEKNELNNMVGNFNKKEDIDDKNMILFKENKNKIIIRDPAHSEYSFLNAISKMIVFLFKIFLVFPLFMLCISLVFLVCSFVLTFLIYKTGLFFIGLLVLGLSLSVINSDFILIILNFIFNRKNDKKKIIYSFIVSIILVGISAGFILTGLTSFEYVENDMDNTKIETKEFTMKDKLTFNFSSNDNIEYIEKNIDNVRIEYQINKACSLYYYNHYDNDSVVYIYANCNDPLKIINQTISNLNNKKIINIDNEFYSIKIYASSDNLNKIKENNKIYE